MVDLHTRTGRGEVITIGQRDLQVRFSNRARLMGDVLIDGAKPWPELRFGVWQSYQARGGVITVRQSCAVVDVVSDPSRLHDLRKVADDKGFSDSSGSLVEVMLPQDSECVDMLARALGAAHHHEDRTAALGLMGLAEYMQYELTTLLADTVIASPLS